MDPKELQEKFKNLPQDIKEAMFDIESAEIIKSLAKKYDLNIEQAGELADETGLLMLGVTQPRNFISNLNKRMKTDEQTTKKIAYEINDQIFSKIKESLKKIHVTEEGKGIGEIKTEATTAPPSQQKPLVPFSKPDEANEAQKESPFEQKLKTGEEQTAIQKELRDAKKEQRYPAEADPYKEPAK